MNKNRKILFFSLTRSGCIEYTQELLRSFESEEVYLIVSKQSAKYFPKAHQTIKTYNSTGEFLIESLKFKNNITSIINQLLEKFEDAIIYFPSFHPWNYLIAKIAKQRKIPFVLTVHDYKAHSSNKVKGLEFIQNKTARLASITVFLSEDQRALAIKDGLMLSKTIHLPHPLFDIPTVNKLEYNSRPKLLFIGYLEKHKGLDLLIECCLDLNIEVLTIAGHGKYSHAQLKSENINFINKKLDTEELYHLIDSHEILILPYLDATQSGVLSLGISKEVVMIITKHAGLQEQLSKNSAMWSNPSIVDLRNSLQKLIDSPQRYKGLKKNLKIEKIEIENSWHQRIKDFKLVLKTLS